MNIALPSPLLSRFDLVLLIKDAVIEDWDNSVTDYILNGRNNYSKLSDNGLWSVDILQVVKTSINLFCFEYYYFFFVGIFCCDKKIKPYVD